MNGRKFFGQLEDLIVAAADESVPTHFGGIRGHERHGDGIVVDIQAEEQHARGSRSSLRLLQAAAVGGTGTFAAPTEVESRSM
jgi:hypothetical protein